MISLDLTFLSWDFFTNYILKGLVFSVQLTIVATIGGIILGTFLAILRLSSWSPLVYIATFYVNMIRSIPLVMVILWFFLLIPLLIGQKIGANLSASITFIAFEAAFYSEIVRAGIQSLPQGQIDAAGALGMSYSQTMRLVVLPQAFRNMIPVLMTQSIILFQDTSLVYAIGAYDLLKGFEIAGQNIGRPVETYILAAITYFVICFSLSKVVGKIHEKIAIIH